MRNFTKILFIVLSLHSSASFATVRYCATANNTAIENTVLQHAITMFSIKEGCTAGDNCISIKPGPAGVTRYAITWKLQCGPVQNGVHTLMNNGKSTVFLCGVNATNKKTCCAPLGLENDSSLRICSF